MGWGKAALGFGADWINENCGCHGKQKLPLTYNGEKWCFYQFSVSFDRMVKFTSSHEFEIFPEWTILELPAVDR